MIFFNIYYMILKFNEFDLNESRLAKTAKNTFSTIEDVYMYLNTEWATFINTQDIEDEEKEELAKTIKGPDDLNDIIYGDYGDGLGEDLTTIFPLFKFIEYMYITHDLDDRTQEYGYIYELPDNKHIIIVEQDTLEEESSIIDIQFTSPITKKTWEYKETNE